jgi:hypothetical protein
VANPESDYIEIVMIRRSTARSAKHASSKTTTDEKIDTEEPKDMPEERLQDSHPCSGVLPRKYAISECGIRHYIETVWGRGYALREPSEYEAESPA